MFGGLTGLTVLMLYAIFPPRAIWGLSFICLVPWTVAVCRVERPWVVHWGSFLFGWLFFAVALSWLSPVTGLGYVALAFYLGIYWPISAWAVRTARRAGIGPAWSLPVTWIACEYLRGWVMTGFPWLFVAHAFYKVPAFIQFSDVTGAYGVSFLVVLVNGALVQWVLYTWRRAGTRVSIVNTLVGTVVTIALLIGNYAYGRMRLAQTDFRDGPRIAVIQEDFPLRSTPPYGDHPYKIIARYLRLAADAAAEAPDLIVFPETVWQATQNVSFVEQELQAADEVPAFTWSYGKLCHEATAAFAAGDYSAVNQRISHFENNLNRQHRSDETRVQLPRLPAGGGPPTPLIVGSVSLDLLPASAYPKQKKYNSALYYEPDGRQRRERYDKIHLVPFGEFVPFRNARFLGMDLHWLYRLLNRLSPFSDNGKVEYSLWPGEKYATFNLPTAEAEWRFGVPICYEDVMPYVVRNYVWEGATRRADFLINISNDGWFRYSDELPQHLGICVFRAVENRIGIARAVNTGISGFIDPNGRLYDLVEEDGLTYKPSESGIVGYRIASVKIDERGSLYGRFGDWFAIACVVLTSLVWIGAIFTRWVFALRKRLAMRRIRKEREHAAQTANPS